MSRTLRPRAACVRKALQQSRRSVTSTPSRRATESQSEEADEPSSQPEHEHEPSSFLSTPPAEVIDAYLRTQNDVYLAKVKRHLDNISITANSINTLLPELSRRSQLIRPPSTSAAQTEKATIAPYAVLPWRISSERTPPVTQALLTQIERVVKNIEDLQSEPYRADVTPSEREKINKQVADWTQESKAKALLAADFEREGIEARFNGGVVRLDNSVKAMFAARVKEMAAREERSPSRELLFRKMRAEPASNAASPSSARTVDRPAISYVPTSNAEDASVTYRPMGSEDVTPAPKVEGWGSSATKVEERGKHHARRENPFATLRKSLEADDSAPKVKANADATTESKPGVAAEVKAEAKAQPPAAPKAPTLMDLQRRMNVSLGK